MNHSSYFDLRYRETFLAVVDTIVKYSHISIDPFCVVTDIHICRHFHISHTSNFATLFLRVSCHQLCLHILSSLVLHGLHGVHV